MATENKTVVASSIESWDVADSKFDSRSSRLRRMPTESRGRSASDRLSDSGQWLSQRFRRSRRESFYERDLLVEREIGCTTVEGVMISSCNFLFSHRKACIPRGDELFDWSTFFIVFLFLFFFFLLHQAISKGSCGSGVLVRHPQQLILEMIKGLKPDMPFGYYWEGKLLAMCQRTPNGTQRGVANRSMADDSRQWLMMWQ